MIICRLIHLLQETLRRHNANVSSKNLVYKPRTRYPHQLFVLKVALELYKGNCVDVVHVYRDTVGNSIYGQNFHHRLRLLTFSHNLYVLNRIGGKLIYAGRYADLRITDAVTRGMLAIQEHQLPCQQTVEQFLCTMPSQYHSRVKEMLCLAIPRPRVEVGNLLGFDPWASKRKTLELTANYAYAVARVNLFRKEEELGCGVVPEDHADMLDICKDMRKMAVDRMDLIVLQAEFKKKIFRRVKAAITELNKSVATEHAFKIFPSAAKTTDLFKKRIALFRKHSPENKVGRLLLKIYDDCLTYCESRYLDEILSEIVSMKQSQLIVFRKL